MSGAVLILSGPSGAGKSTIISKSEDRIGEFTSQYPPQLESLEMVRLMVSITTLYLKMSLREA